MSSSDHPTDIEPARLEERILAEYGWVRALAARLVRSDSDADDVTQDVVAAALDRRPRIEGPAGIRRWLFEVTRRQAARWRARRARRRDVETQGHLDRDPVTEPSDAADRLQRHKDLTDAVLALPAPYRSVVVARYLDGHSCARIAALTGEREATVRQRLSRALAKLRQALGKKHGRGWAGALVPLIAGGDPMAVPTSVAASDASAAATNTTAGTATTIAGGLLMNKLAIAGLTIMCAIGAWWIAAQPDTPNVTAPTAARDPGHDSTFDSAQGPVAKEGNDSSVERGNRSDVERTSIATPTANAALLRGRCVDAAGNAIAGVRVELDGWGHTDEAVTAYRLQHGAVDWQGPTPIETDHDGCFELRFTPPPPFQFALHLRKTGFADMYGRWSSIAENSTKDFGNISFTPGVAVSGRVLDVDGAPRERVQINLRRPRSSRSHSELHPRDFGSAYTRKDGTFAMRTILAPGEWTATLRGAQFVEADAPNSMTVELTLPESELALVVRRTSDIPVVSGTVIDDAGNPVHRAMVRTVTDYGSGSSTTTARDGTFRIQKVAGRDPNGEFRLEVECNGHEYLLTEDLLRWGTADARLTVRRGVGVAIYVRRAVDDAPVESFRFVLRPVPKPETRPHEARLDRELKNRSQHPSGHLALPRVCRGTYLLFVEPSPTSGLGASGPIEFEVGDGPPVILEVRLPALTQQRVVARFPDGAPVSGSALEVLELLDASKLQHDTRALTLDELHMQSHNHAMLVDRVTLDATGAGVVTGPVGRTLSLRVQGEHAPHVRTHVEFGGEPIELTVSPGAALQVTLGPPELLADLREQAGLPRTGEVPVAGQGYLPGIRLKARDAVMPTYFPPATHGREVVFDDRGVAAMRGIPPGQWDLELMTWVRNPGGAGGGGTTLRTRLELHDGEQTTVELDRPQDRPGRLRGVVAVSGRPHEGRVELTCRTRRPDGTEYLSYRYAESDAEGRFECLVPPGDWHAGPWVRVGDRGLKTRSRNAASVTAGETTEADFDLRLGTAKVRILGPTGEPVENLRLEFRRDGKTLGTNGKPTDAKGRTTITATVGDGQPRVRIRSLLDLRTFHAHLRSHPDSMLAKEQAYVTLPPITFTEHEAGEIEIRLPADWDR